MNSDDKKNIKSVDSQESVVDQDSDHAGSSATAGASSAANVGLTPEEKKELKRLKHKEEMAKLIDEGISEQKRFWTDTVPKLLNFLTLILSFGLIAFISYDTYEGMDFTKNTAYMNYQLIVCCVFLAEFVYRFFISEHKFSYLFFNLPFLIISIPYLNIIDFYQLQVPKEALYYIRFIPMIRGMVALTVVVTYAAQNLTTTVCASYILVLAMIVYMSGLIFYTEEKGINAGVKNFWYAMWWAGMNVTTIGCDINPMTPIGMILGLMLSLLGIIMFPLFTVYFGAVLREYSHKRKVLNS